MYNILTTQESADFLIRCCLFVLPDLFEPTDVKLVVVAFKKREKNDTITDNPNLPSSC